MFMFECPGNVFGTFRAVTSTTNDKVHYVPTKGGAERGGSEMNHAWVRIVKGPRCWAGPPPEPIRNQWFPQGFGRADEAALRTLTTIHQW
jgi:hypothetical protein